LAVAVKVGCREVREHRWSNHLDTELETKEDLLRSGEGAELKQEDMPSTFILMGLEIEESQ
jgi:hypothetical protein